MFATVNALLPNDVTSIIEMLRGFSAIWRDMRDEGIISKVSQFRTTNPLNSIDTHIQISLLLLQEEFSRSTFAYASRTDADIRLPFEDASSRVHASGLRLVTSRLHHVPCAFRKTWLASGKKAEGKYSHCQLRSETVRYVCFCFFFQTHVALQPASRLRSKPS